MINPNIHVQKCEQLDAAIVEIAALKQQLQSAREELQEERRVALRFRRIALELCNNDGGWLASKYLELSEGKS